MKWLNYNDIHRSHQLFAWDMEWIGSLPATPGKCRITEIACRDLSSGESFSIRVKPLAPAKWVNTNAMRPTCSHIPGSVPLSTAIELLSNWLHRVLVPGRVAVLISHNGFKNDSLVLRSECHRCGVRVSAPFLMMDSMLYFRHVLRGRTSNFDIPSLCELLNVSVDDVKLHTAEYDCIVLGQLLSAVQRLAGAPGLISGLAIPPGKVSLTCIRGIGVSTACRFMDIGILDLWELSSAVCSLRGAMACGDFMAYMRPLMSKDRNQEETLASATHAADKAAVLFGAHTIEYRFHSIDVSCIVPMYNRDTHECVDGMSIVFVSIPLEQTQQQLARRGGSAGK